MKKPRRRNAPEPSSPQPEGRHQPPAPLARLLDAAQDALTEYDYDQARALLQQAFDLCGGDATAALPLLTLLVDHLATDEEALALAPRLSASARGDEAVRGLLALAAARTGHTEQALSLLAGLDPAMHPRSADALVILARGAWQRGDPRQAELLLERTRGCRPPHPEAAALEREIQAQRAHSRGPLEQEAQLYLDLAEHEQAERAAREILSRWPESAAARRVLRAVQEHRLSLAGEEVLRLAGEEADAGRREEALGRLRGALATFAGPAPLRALLEEQAAALSRLLDEERDAALVREVLDLLRAGSTAQGLLRFIDLAPRLRPRVREPLRGEEALPLLGHVEALLERVRPAPPAAALVSAVLALAAADRDPEAAEALLAPHRPILLHLSQGRRLFQDLEQRQAMRAQERARERLRAASTALSHGRLDEVHAALSSPELRALPASLKEEAEALQRALDQEEERRRLAASFAQLRDRGESLGARDLASQLARLTQGEEQARWAAEQAALTGRIQRAFSVSSRPGPGPAAELYSLDLDRASTLNQVPFAALPDGGLLAAQSEDRVVLLWVIDPDTATARWRACLRTPEALNLEHVGLAGEVLSLVGSDGILQLRWPDLEVLLWRGKAELVPRGKVLERAVPAPDGRHLWLELRTVGGVVTEVVAVDLKRRESTRRLGPGGNPTALPGREGLMAAMRRQDSEAGLYEPRGTLVRKIQVQGMIHHLCPGPDGSVALLSSDCSTDGAPFQCWIAPAQGRTLPPMRVSRSCSDGPSSLSAAPAHGLVFVYFENGDGEMRLLALEARQGTLQSRYEVDAPPRLVMVQALETGRAHGAYMDADGLHLAELGPEPPDLPCQDERIELDLKMWSCRFRAGLDNAAASELAKVLRPLSIPERRLRVKELRDRRASSPGALLELVHAIDAVEYGAKEGTELLQWVLERHPDHPLSLVARALDAAEAERWPEVADALTPIAAWEKAGDDLPPRRMQHVWHVLARARLEMGQPEQALAALRAGQDIVTEERGCSFEDLQCLMPLSEPPEDPVAQLRLLIRDATRHIEREDAEAAIRLLDVPLVWSRREVQSMARLAAACLRSGRDEVSREREIRVLSAYLELIHGFGRHGALDLPLSEGRWSQERLKELALRCEGRLDEILSA
jgi:hypothetical protein